MSVERINVEPVSRQVEQPHYGVPPQPPPEPQGQQPYVHAYTQAQVAQIAAANKQVQHRAALNARVMALLNAVSLIVSARILLLLAVCFGFVLALQAEGSQTKESIAVLIAWSVLTVLPLVILDVLARSPMKTVQPEYGGAR